MRELELMDVDSHDPFSPVGRNGRDAHIQAYAARSWAKDAAHQCLEKWLTDAEERLTLAKQHLSAARKADWAQRVKDDPIQVLLDHTDHPVVERYLIAFIGYTGDLESASREDILRGTLTLDIDLNIRLRRIDTEFFDDDGELIPTPDDWVAQELLGFESTYPVVTLQQILADIEAYTDNPADWPDLTPDERTDRMTTTEIQWEEHSRLNECYDGDGAEGFVETLNEQFPGIAFRLDVYEGGTWLHIDASQTNAKKYEIRRWLRENDMLNRYSDDDDDDRAYWQILHTPSECAITS